MWLIRCFYVDQLGLRNQNVPIGCSFDLTTPQSKNVMFRISNDKDNLRHQK